MRIKPKKRLGQNFLTDKNIQNKIIQSCGFASCDTVLEIGSGRAEMSRLIAPLVRKLYAVEIDLSLDETLKDALSPYANTEIINGDILKIDLGRWLDKSGSRKVKAFGNIPYYITTPIIERLLEYRGAIEAIYLTVQKELAARIAAAPGTKDYGSFSCFVQYYACPEILFNISKGCFYPRPKVDSSFLKLLIRKKPKVAVDDEIIFFRIIRAAFNQRRKILKNSLEGVISKERLENFLAGFNINRNVRPEEMSLEDFARLANEPYGRRP